MNMINNTALSKRLGREGGNLYQKIESYFSPTPAKDI
jgi:hypothetical protein